jgi:hypothetical protein
MRAHDNSVFIKAICMHTPHAHTMADLSAPPALRTTLPPEIARSINASRLQSMQHSAATLAAIAAASAGSPAHQQQQHAAAAGAATSPSRLGTRSAPASSLQVALEIAQLAANPPSAVPRRVGGPPLPGLAPAQRVLRPTSEVLEAASALVSATPAYRTRQSPSDSATTSAPTRTETPPPPLRRPTVATTAPRALSQQQQPHIVAPVAPLALAPAGRAAAAPPLQPSRQAPQKQHASPPPRAPHDAEKIRVPDKIYWCFQRVDNARPSTRLMRFIRSFLVSWGQEYGHVELLFYFAGNDTDPNNWQALTVFNKDGVGVYKHPLDYFRDYHWRILMHTASHAERRALYTYALSVTGRSFSVTALASIVSPTLGWLARFARCCCLRPQGGEGENAKREPMFCAQIMVEALKAAWPERFRHYDSVSATPDTVESMLQSAFSLTQVSFRVMERTADAAIHAAMLDYRGGNGGPINV